MSRPDSDPPAAGAAPSREDARPAAGPRDAPDASRAARRALRRKLAIVLLMVGLCAGAVVTRAVWAGMRALADGDGAHARGDERAAIEDWRRAARWYVPGASHVEVAYERLDEAARAAEERGDIDTALAAWRGVRSSILATRSFYLPHEDRLDPANQRIAALMAAQERSRGASERSAHDERAERHYQLLRRELGPSPLWSVIALLGLALWLGGGLLFALRGVTADDRLVPRTAGYGGVLVALGLVIWLLGLHLA